MTFTWDFGDGSAASHEVHPTHVYPAPGLYTVTLTATHALGTATATGVVEITAPPLFPQFLPAVLYQPPAAVQP
jgi:PKD repeat protein